MVDLLELECFINVMFLLVLIVSDKFFKIGLFLVGYLKVMLFILMCFVILLIL